MQPYKQTTEFTGAASALLMVINDFNPQFELSRENEFMIWRSTVNLPTRASSIYGLASFAKRRGMQVEVYVGKQELDYPDYRFKGYKKEEVEAAAFTEQLHLIDLEKLQIKVNTGEFTLDQVKKLLKDRILILRLDAGVFRDLKPSSSYVVVAGYSNNKYTLYDPYTGKLIITDEQMKQSFEDLTIKRKRDHRMIVFS